MHIRTIIISLIVLATAALAALNWGALSAPSTINFGVTTMEAPLGLIMLGLTTALVAVFVAYVVYPAQLRDAGGAPPQQGNVGPA